MTSLQADGNHDGIVGSADYVVWRSNFGGTASPAPNLAESIGSSGSVLSSLAVEKIESSQPSSVEALDTVLDSLAPEFRNVDTVGKGRDFARVQRQPAVQHFSNDFLLMSDGRLSPSLLDRNEELPWVTSESNGTKPAESDLGGLSSSFTCQVISGVKT